MDYLLLGTATSTAIVLIEVMRGTYYAVYFNNYKFEGSGISALPILIPIQIFLSIAFSGLFYLVNNHDY